MGPPAGRSYGAENPPPTRSVEKSPAVERARLFEEGASGGGKLPGASIGEVVSQSQKPPGGLRLPRYGECWLSQRLGRTFLFPLTLLSFFDRPFLLSEVPCQPWWLLNVASSSDLTVSLLIKLNVLPVASSLKLEFSWIFLDVSLSLNPIISLDLKIANTLDKSHFYIPLLMRVSWLAC